MQAFLAFTCAIKRKQSRKSRIRDTLKSAVLQSSKSKCHRGKVVDCSRKRYERHLQCMNLDLI